MRLHVCVVLLFSLVYSDGAKILGFFSLPTHSHFVMGSKLLKELARRGHQVTIIGSSNQKERVENLTEIVIDTEYLINDAMRISPVFRNDPNYFDMADQSFLATLGQGIFIDRLGRLVTEKMLSHPKILNLYNETFDLIIADIWISQALIGFSDIFHCPFVVFSTVGPNPYVDALVLNPAPYSYVSDLVLGFPPQMNFWQRLANVYLGILHRIYRNVYDKALTESILKKHFKNSPELKDLQEKYLALILINSNPIINYPQPSVPSMVEIGGFHVEKPRPLPEDLQEFMDGAEEGVILFSLGSLLKSTELPLDKRNAIVRTFGKLKQRVVWKYENDTLPGKPGNVKISKWLPVNDVLAHPNLRAFISHGGIMSTTEAIHQGVPIIGLPIFFDQFTNIENAVNRNFALVQPLKQLTEESFTRTIEEIIRNDSYRESAKKFSKILKDQPISPLDKAIFWIEYVIRNKGAEHLKTSAHHLHWTQLYLLDVIAFTITLIACTYYLLKIFSRNKNTKIKTN